MSRSLVLAVLSTICVVLIGVLTGIFTKNLPAWVGPYIGYAGLALLLAILLLIVLRVIESRLRPTGPTAPPDPEQLKRNRRQMLARVRHDWIDGVLNQSLYQVARIDLGLEDRPDVVDYPLALVVQEAERPACLLPPRTRIRTVFDAHSGAGGLLILGEPGGGKTTLLLELTQDLLDRAGADETNPIPVIFNLSSWALRRPPLADWLAEELNQRYDVPREMAGRWVTTDQVLPLLDGLDEVAAEHRAACVEQINGFRNKHFLPMAVCSRTKEYESLARRLRMPAAVVVQPLTQAELEEYLERGGERLAGICTALERDETLWELLDTPLMLSIMMLAYQSVADSTSLAGETLEVRRRHLFARYVDTMFNRRAKGTRYTREQTLRWLTWLASSMTRLDQSGFQLESLNRDWLRTQRQQALVGWAVKLVPGLVGVVVGGLIGWLGPAPGGWLFSSLVTELAPGLHPGPGRALAAWLVAGFFNAWARIGAEQSYAVAGGLALAGC